MDLIPIVVKKTAGGERSYDIFSFLLRNRIVFITGAINDHMASIVCAQLLFLDSIDPKSDIHLYIMSPGGVVSAALAIYDTIRCLRADVQTWGLGIAASCGSFLLTAGTKGKRNALEHTRIMIHEPWGGYQGRSRHIEDHANEIRYTREVLTRIYNRHTGQSKDTIEKWMERETFFSAQEAKELGIIDNIRTSYNYEEARDFDVDVR